MDVTAGSTFMLLKHQEQTHDSGECHFLMLGEYTVVGLNFAFS